MWIQSLDGASTRTKNRGLNEPTSTKKAAALGDRPRRAKTNIWQTEGHSWKLHITHMVHLDFEALEVPDEINKISNQDGIKPFKTFKLHIWVEEHPLTIYFDARARGLRPIDILPLSAKAPRMRSQPLTAFDES